MNKFKFVLIAAMGWSLLADHSLAQETNVYGFVPPTVLETLESTAGQLVVKGTAPIGSVSADGVLITLVCKEDMIPSSGHKEHGIQVGIKIGDQPEDRTIIDFDEIESLLGSLDYLSKVNWSVTPLTSFEASYVTKGGLRVMAFSSKRAGQIEFGLRSLRMSKRILLPPDQVSLLRSLVDQAKKKLEALRAG